MIKICLKIVKFFTKIPMHSTFSSPKIIDEIQPLFQETLEGVYEATLFPVFSFLSEFAQLF